MADNLNNNEELARLLKSFSSKSPGERSVQAAQRAFYDLLVADLDRHVLKLVKFNEDVAQAAMQNAWLRIFMTAHSYDPKLASVKTWAKKIGEQCAIDELRRVYRHKKREVVLKPRTGEAAQGSDEIDDLDGFACPLPGPEEQMQAKQVLQAIADCIQRLPASAEGPNYRLAMKLSLDNEMDYKQMQEMFAAQSPRHHDINSERVRSWVREAAKKMKGCIEGKLGRRPSEGGRK